MSEQEQQSKRESKEDDSTSACMEGEVATAEEIQLKEGYETASISEFSRLEFEATGDVFIQAGHLHTPDGYTGGVGPLGREIDWTPVVTDEATRILRAAGVSVIKSDASIKNTRKMFKATTAVFIHFDSSKRGTQGASVGYDDDSDIPAAHAWKELYSTYWPREYGWEDDNYTKELRGYYGYSHTITTDGEVVLELGDINSLAQSRWLKPRLKWLGALVAHFLSKRIGKGNVPDPGPFR